MTRDTVFTEIARLLERFRAGDKAINFDTVIAEDLTMDSLQVMMNWRRSTLVMAHP